MSKKYYFRLLLALIGSLGVILQIAKDGFGMLLYYTVLSNLLVIFFLCYCLHREKRNIMENQYFYRLKGGVTMAITITFIVYHFLLSPFVKAEDFWNLRNFIVHYIVPIGFILDTLLVDIKKQYKWFDPLIWTIIPLLYFAFALLNGLVLKLAVPGAPDSPFPYYFINITKYGLLGVTKNSLFIFIGYIVFGYFLNLVKYFCGQSIVSSK